MAAPLGVDFGKVRIGLATCPGGLISVPLKIVLTRRRPWADLAQELVETAQQQGHIKLHYSCSTVLHAVIGAWGLIW